MRGLVRFGGVLAAAAVVSFGASGITRTSGGAPVPVHQLRLGPFVVPPTRMVGLIVKARVNGGPELRLLLDSGASMITLDTRAAAKSNCVGGIDYDLVGAG